LFLESCTYHFCSAPGPPSLPPSSTQAMVS
jgi:hypothetical protein